MPKARWTKCVPIALWPPADRAAWEAAMRRRDPFEDAGLATRWSAATRRKTACGYGRFLFWLLERGELDVTADPAARITHERLTSYLEDLRSANRGHTIHNRIQELGDAMRALAPDHEWSFIRRVAARLRADAVPARDKRGRLPPIAEIVAQGYRMMARAERLGARSELEHVPPQLNRGILVRRRMGESIGTDSLLGAGRCRGLIPGTCVSE